MRNTLLFLLLFVYGFVFGQGTWKKLPYTYKPGDSVLVFSVKGIVTDKKHNKPIKGAIVNKVGSDGSVNAVETDSLGQYTFGPSYIKPETSYILSAEAKDQNYIASPNKVNINTVGLNASKVFVIGFTLKKWKGCTFGQNFVALFDSGKTRITYGTADTILSNVLKLLKDNPTIVIQVDGHSSSNEGNEQTKMALSKARAEAYRNYLIAFGIDARRIKTKGWSDSVKVTIPEDDAEDMTKEQQQEYLSRRSRYTAIRIISYRYKPTNTVVH